MFKNKLNVFYSIIVLSFVPMIIMPILFLNTGFFIFPDDILVVIGSWLGLLAFMFIFWQYALGVKPFVKLFVEDYVATNKLHQTFGIYGFFLILLHPIIIVISYLSVRGENLINLDFTTPLFVAVKFGEVAIVLIMFNWIMSYVLRSNVSFRWWKRLHLLNYLILPILYLHAKDIGTFIQDPILKLYFDFLVFLFVLVFIYRLGKQFGFFKYKYRVTNILQITHDVIQVSFTPVKLGNFINPREGQFIELQLTQWGETHPFTVAEYNSENHDLSIAPKVSGKFSASLMNLKMGELVYLDGPYGVFTKEAYKPNATKVVLIAGGIGITPFLRLLDYFNLNNQKFQEFTLFYGNKDVGDIAYNEKLEELKRFQNFKVVNVLSKAESTNSEHEKGYITTDVMKKYLKEDLSNYKFFICGPPIMMDMIEVDLKKSGVKKGQIYFEKFSW